MKIVVLDGYTENPGDLSWDGLAALGELTVYERTSPELCAKRIGDAEAIFTNKTEISGEVIRGCPKLKFIGVLATGYNVIDLPAADAGNIVVCNIPAYGTAAVAQFTMALLLELCHHAGEHSACVMKGEWTDCQDWCFWNYPLVELAGKTMGIIGYGRIGRSVANLAKAFGMRVLAYDPMAAAVNGQQPEDELTELDELYRQADVISLHCPLLDSTAELINRNSIAKMKPGVMIINASRGPLIAEHDLRAALESGKVAGAAVDVVSAEPIRADNPLLGAPNMIITPHIAWASKEARQRLMDIAVANLAAFIGGSAVNVVNKPKVR